MNNNYVIVLSFSLFLTACGQKKEDKEAIIRPVKTAIVESRSEIKKDFSGIVEAVDYVKLAFRVSGQIINLPVIEGEKVKKGQLIAPGIEITLSGIRFSSTYAAHSDEHPIGVVIEGDGKVVCHTGDTMFHKRLPSEYPQGADLLMLPINGSGYNMNAVDAARLTAILAPKAVLPMHWDMFKAYGCDVNEFIEEFRDGGQRILVPEHYAEFEV